MEEETTDIIGFNPQEVDMTKSQHELSLHRYHDLSGKRQNDLLVSWHQDYSKDVHDPDNVKPYWADYDISQRVFTSIDEKQFHRMVRQVFADPGTFEHELPCPPYRFEYDNGTLSIHAGAFKKGGSKSEWRTVINQMMEEVEGMPDGIDVTDLPAITIDLKMVATTSIDLEVDQLLEGHDMYDGELWTGDKGDLEMALEEAIDNYDFDDSNVELSYAEMGEVEVDGHDLDYTMRKVEEL